ncbi:MAG TPA: D-glycero-beta-D-manno-heptose-7-phosphate kinase [Aliidongia sp.]|uniref:D-glycero-beta-D-manno-heptose-7-phosphate kinase n=1 Tax=Aliidongia sp. TaxID=1914230 RepID=UPI002DDD4BA2|nr:D-glycero-beta-D-manno-heptose-7-phosphate kinase [Aliidongia sp.]HEV2674584.1 D-glycero-beta-D-manno-heptose-7-phosphate kinase [Aliidongia sp.]
MIATNPLLERIDRFTGCTILILGDVMLDTYVYGQVERVSPEAPIPVLRIDKKREMLGGAGNVARNVAALGARAILIGVTGEDDAGRAIETQIAEADGARIDGRLVVDQGRPTTRKTRFVSGSQQLLRVDEEIARPLDGGPAEAVLTRFRAALSESDIVVLSDYSKGVLSDAVLAPAIAAARAAGKRIIADPKSRDFSRYRLVDVLKPNRLEITQATGIDCRDDATTEQAGRAALATAEAGAVVVTRGAHGVSIIPKDGPALHLPTLARAVFDVSGAGDTLVACLAVALAAGADLAEATALANAAAGIVVGKAGTECVSPVELSQGLHLGALIETDRKVTTLTGALDQAARWRAAGLRVGFTNGCFDLIHPGHVRLLGQARAACDRLIVGLNTDASVKRLKGPERPVQNELARATVMASIGAVDLVVLFGEDTPLEIIETLKPDVLIKGADYRIDQVVGADVVQSYGGKVILAELEAGQSTTGTIDRIREIDDRA